MVATAIAYSSAITTLQILSNSDINSDVVVQTLSQRLEYEKLEILMSDPKFKSQIAIAFLANLENVETSSRVMELNQSLDLDAALLLSCTNGYLATVRMLLTAVYRHTNVCNLQSLEVTPR